MSKHTPGPWEPMMDGPDKREPWEPWTAYMEAAPGLTIASPRNTEPIARVSGYLQPVVANARLIAAAPDLLAALKESLIALHNLAPQELRKNTTSETLCWNYPSDKPCGCTSCTIRAAIAKAES